MRVPEDQPAQKAREGHGRPERARSLPPYFVQALYSRVFHKNSRVRNLPCSGQLRTRFHEVVEIGGLEPPTC